jgi:dTMP kinase
MKIHRHPGYFVALEGLDGSGSDEITKALERKLKLGKVSLIAVKEPSSGPVGLLIKKLLLKKSRLSSLAMAFLFAADREWLMTEKIEPALAAGKLVISDRCLWSTVAYQSLDLPIHWLLEINQKFSMPNITYFIDVSPQICAGRIKRGEDELQVFSEEDRLAQIQDGYHWIFNKYPYWFKVIDGEKDQREMVKEIIDDLKKKPKIKKLVKIK